MADVSAITPEAAVIRGTYQHVKALVDRHVTQDELRADLVPLYEQGNTSVRIALHEMNEALSAYGYYPIPYQKLTGDRRD